MRLFNNLVLTAVGIVLSTSVVLAAEWYEDYENAKEAIAKQQWQSALNLVNSAMLAKDKPSANAKTYGLRFIDYFPYLYRGIAKYHLGDFIGSEMDLKNSIKYGQVRKAKRDRDASKKLEEYLNLLSAQKSMQTKNLEETDLQAVRKLMDQKKYEAAVKILRDFLERNPLHQEGQSLLKEIETGLEAALARSPAKESPAIARESEKQKDAAKIEKTKPSRPITSGKNDKVVVKIDKDLDRNFRGALALLEAGDLKAARLKFQQVSKASTNYLEATEYLQKINQAEKQVQEGVISFFDGNTEQSIKWFSQALSVYQTNLNVYAFLGSAHATEYFLSGEEDEESLQKALAEFDKIKKMDSEYRLDSRYFSPRIVGLFLQTRQNL